MLCDAHEQRDKYMKYFMEALSIINTSVLKANLFRNNVSTLKSLLSLHVKYLSLDTDSLIKVMFDLKLPGICEHNRLMQ